MSEQSQEEFEIALEMEIARYELMLGAINKALDAIKTSSDTGNMRAIRFSGVLREAGYMIRRVPEFERKP